MMRKFTLRCDACRHPAEDHGITPGRLRFLCWECPCRIDGPFVPHYVMCDAPETCRADHAKRAVESWMAARG